MRRFNSLLLMILIIDNLLYNSCMHVQAAEHSEDIIGQVTKYTSNFDSKAINNYIKNGEYQKAKDLIETAKDGYRERWDYIGLTTNDMYIAYQFKEYMTDDLFSKGWWAKITSWFSSLFYNDELKEYLSMQSPGVNKYKDMLKQFIGDTKEELVVLEYAKKISSSLESVDGLYQYIDVDTYDILYDMFAQAGSKDEVDKAVLNFVNDNPLFFKNESMTYLFKNDLSKSFTVFGAGVDYIDTTVSGIMDIQYACANMDVLNYYDDFLINIQQAKYDNGNYIAPEDLRVAAAELRQELEGNVLNIIADKISEYGVTTATTSIELMNLIGEGLLGEILLGMDIGSLVGNAIFDMGSLVKGISYVQGYAYVGEIYSIILEKDKDNFLKEKSEENAQLFRKDYEILWNIRLEGEKAYIDMSDFSETWDKDDQKILRYWTDYENKQQFVYNNIEMIEDFKFMEPIIKKEKSLIAAYDIIDIKSEHGYDERGEYGIFSGITKDGTVIWTYETKYYEPTELEQVTGIGINSDMYYLNESGTIVALDLQTGQVRWSNDDFGGASISYDFDENGTMYACGFYGPDLYIIDKNGNTMGRYDNFIIGGIEYYCPYKIQYNFGDVFITYDGSTGNDFEESYVLIYNINDKTIRLQDINHSSVYDEFILEGLYNQYTDEWFNPAIEYTVIDINQDKIPELLIGSDWDMEWRSTLVFTFDPVSEEIIFIQDIYHFSDIRYSPKYKAIVYTDFRPSTICSAYIFDTIENTKIVSLFTVGDDLVNGYGEGTETYSYIYRSGIEKEITNDEKQEYFSELKEIDFISIPINKKNNIENDLKGLLKSTVSDPILNFIYDDFDNDGNCEAIAFCGEEYPEDGYFGTLYFVTHDSVKTIREKDGYWNCGEIFDFGNAKIVSITKYFTTGGISFYYLVSGENVIEIDGSGCGTGLFEDEQGRIYMTDSQYDACVDGTGHTWNVYYFYWDNGLKEYGGVQISTDEFLIYGGADEILKKITEDGYEITTIYKRENGIINVNCCDGWSNNNVRILYENGRVEVLPVTEGFYYEEGIIKSALIPDIATY